MGGGSKANANQPPTAYSGQRDPQGTCPFVVTRVVPATRAQVTSNPTLPALFDVPRFLRFLEARYPSSSPLVWSYLGRVVPNLLGVTKFPDKLILSPGTDTHTQVPTPRPMTSPPTGCTQPQPEDADSTFFSKLASLRTSLVIHWLRFHTSNVWV